MKIGQIKTRDYKRLFIICGILILGISISFAYFLNNQGVFGVGSKTDVTTATLGSSTIKIEGTLNFNDLDILPGHKNISAIKLTATGDNELISYNLIWKGTNTLNTPLNYTVYKTSAKIDTKATCEAKTKVENGKQILSEECSISNLNQLGSVIATGTIETTNSEAKVILVEDEMITATTDGDMKYYYIILEYPNLDTSQNSDIGGSFDGTLTIEKGNAKPDVNIMAVYIKGEGDTDYVKSDDIPRKDSGLGFNKNKSNCTNDAIPIWNSSSWNITIDNLTKSGTSCYLYFDEYDILSNLIPEGITTDDSMFSGTSGDGVYTWTKGDYSGGSQLIKYYRGNVKNNWVIFGKDGDQYIWWRIIRNNSNGSFRMIYAGLSDSKMSAPANSTAMLSAIAFNSSYDKNYYVGLKYSTDSIHGTSENASILGISDSTDKSTLYGWYNATLAKSATYSEKLDLTAGFCSDRTHSKTNTLNSATDTVSDVSAGYKGTIYYGAYTRLRPNNSTSGALPSLKCLGTNDKITDIPVGMITADEVNMAGMMYSSGNGASNYLNIGQHYWTMSPFWFYSSTNQSYMFYVTGTTGVLSSTGVAGSNIGARPVINLKSDTLFVQGGTGTSTNPYVVSGT